MAKGRVLMIENTIWWTILRAKPWRAGKSTKRVGLETTAATYFSHKVCNSSKKLVVQSVIDEN